jgi:5-methylcytosine-specific restriction protein A
MKTLQTRIQAPTARRETPAARGYDAKWRTARAAFLRLHPLCTYCQADARIVPATVVDHIVPHRGDRSLFWSRENWQPLCAPCHNSRKAREEHQAGLR